MNFTPFETTRLRLRPQEARDAGFALCIWGDPITGKYLSDPALDDIDDLNEYIDLLRHLSDSQDCYYLIAEDKTTHQPVGTCWRRHQRGRRVLGYWLLHPSHLLAAGLCQGNGNRPSQFRRAKRRQKVSGRRCRRKHRFLPCSVLAGFYSHRKRHFPPWEQPHRIQKSDF